MKVLIVEDDNVIVEGLRIALSQEKFEVDAFGTVCDAIDAIKEGVHYDVCLLDVNLPDGDGYQICKAIREKSEVPIIFLTACDDEIHTVLALEQGADDYIAKPFRIRELIARMNAVIRRSKTSGTVGNTSEDLSNSMHIGRCELDIQSGKIKRGEEEIFLSAVEYRLLLIFARNRGSLLTRQNILNEMWDSAGDFVNDNTLTVYVRRLRKKLELDGDEPVITTIRGIGYRMD